MVNEILDSVTFEIPIIMALAPHVRQAIIPGRAIGDTISESKSNLYVNKEKKNNVKNWIKPVAICNMYIEMFSVKNVN